MTGFGIDLGTTFSLLAQASDGRARVLAGPSGEASLPSIVRVKPDRVVVGSAAGRSMAIDPDNTIGFFKTEMGRSGAGYMLAGREWSPSALSAEVLKQLLEDTRRGGVEVDQAVITVPAYFGDHARLATFQAAELANLRVTELIHEPTAAAIAYGVGKNRAETVLVYDLGGGTFDVSLVRLAPDEIRVLATGGHHELGGRNFDELLADVVAERFRERHGIDPQEDPADAALLQTQVEGLKRALSELRSAECTVVAGGASDSIEVTRDQFEEHAAPLMLTTADLLDRVLADAGVSPSDLDAVLLVGGSTRMPMCEKLVSERLGMAPQTGLNPNEVVALGAALRAEAATDTARAAVPGPARALHDVTAHALGYVVVSADGERYVNDVMIPRNAQVPAQKLKQRSIRTQPGGGELYVHLLQGDSRRPLDNEPLGRYSFQLPAGNGGEALVDIRFAYDEDAIVRISARVGDVDVGKPEIDRDDLDLAWTDGSPQEQVGATAPVEAILLIDTSGSMAGAPIQAAKDASRVFIEELGDDHRVGVIAFETSARIEAALGTRSGKLAAAVDKLRAGGGTSLESGLVKCRSEFFGGATSGSRDSRLQLALGGRAESRQARRVIVVLSDGGTANPGESTRLAKELARDEVDIVTVGLPGANKRFLDTIKTIDGDTFMASIGDLVSTFRGIAKELRNDDGLSL
jgi:molecular chaperone DnaK